MGVIWSSGENSMKIYMGGRQIFESPQEVHKRGRLKINNGLIDKVLVQMSLILLY